MKASREIRDFAAAILVEMMPVLDDKQQRRLSGIAASGLGYGGVSFVNSITGQSRNTIAAGTGCSDGADVGSAPRQPSAEAVSRQDERIRRPGGGRKPIENK